VDEGRFPLTERVNFIRVLLEEGDCMYVPAYFYIQSQTVEMVEGEETIMVAE